MKHQGQRCHSSPSSGSGSGCSAAGDADDASEEQTAPGAWVAIQATTEVMYPEIRRTADKWLSFKQVDERKVDWETYFVQHSG
jgi:hypothetical protein